MLLGQSLIKQDLRALDPAQFRQLAAQIEGAGACFTDLEGVLDEDRSEHAEFTA